jgi:hypothetical protein
MGTPRWSAEDEFIVRRLYASTSNAQLAEIVGRSPRNVGQYARKLGLKKSAKYIARARPGQFNKGQEPPNKGLRRPGWAPGRMANTQFKCGERRGAAARLYQPIGTTRITKDGYLQRKVNDGMPLQQRWKAVHALMWEAANGPVPPGHVVVFREGRKTIVESEITLDRLELVSRAELMRRNTVHRLPPELREVIQLTGALKRKIKSRSKSHAERRA